MTAASKDFLQIQRNFAGHIRDPEHAPAPADVEDRRMAVYRELFFNNVAGFLANSFPVIRRIYGEARWNALMRSFLIHHRASTPLFPELPREFLKFVERRREDGVGDPDWLLELAHYEWAELALSLDEAELDDRPADRDGDLIDGVPVLSPLAWLLSYRYPVHRIRPDFQPDQAPSESTHIVVYRGGDDKVRFTEVNAVSARLLQLIADDDDRTGREQLTQLAVEMGADPARIIEAGRDMLADFRTREIILGTR